MAAAKKMKTRDFAEFENIVSFGEKIKAYWEENARQIIAICLIICLAAGGFAYWTISSRSSAQAAQSLLNQALTMMDSAAPAKGDRPDALPAAITLLDRAAKEYGRTEAGRTALFYRAQCKYRQKDYNGAITDYTAYLQHAGQMADQLRPLALENLGYAYEALGDSAEALQWFEKAVQAGCNAALIGAARMHEASGSTKRACENYKRYLAAEPDSGYRELVEVKIDSLCRS